MMSFKEFKTICVENVAGPHQDRKSKNSVSPSLTSLKPSLSSLTISVTQEETRMKTSKMFDFINKTYKDLQRYNLSTQNELCGRQLMQTLNNFKNGCNKIYANALESYEMCRKLAQNIIRTIDIFKGLCIYMSDLEEYNYRLCEVLSIFITCELRLSVDAAEHEQHLIANRIIYIMRRHLAQEGEQETIYNILRTLVYIPKLFNARDIMCAIFGEFIPIKHVLEVKVLPDKLYMLYIIVFFRWMMMQKEDDDKMLIVNFAESFMKPSVSLCSNRLYGTLLPKYTTHSTATRTILNNLKFYRDIRNACIIDNALKNVGYVVNLCDEDEDDDIVVVDTNPTADFVQIFASTRIESVRISMSSIKLEEKTVVDVVDLTEDNEPSDATTYLNESHDKWLNAFQRSAKQYLESQLLMEKLQSQLISNGEKDKVICVDSDSDEEENIENTASDNTPTVSTPTTIHQNTNESFADNYPITNNGLESLDVDDENDVTQISHMFLSGNLRTYETRKKSNLPEIEEPNHSDTDGQNASPDNDTTCRRDSIHLSSHPEGPSPENEDDEGTDVQDELDEEEEPNTFPEINIKAVRPMRPYPTYNNVNNGITVAPEILSKTHQQEFNYKQFHSNSLKTDTSKSQNKNEVFHSNPLGRTVSRAPQKNPLKSAHEKTKCTGSDASSTACSTSSISSSIKRNVPTIEKYISHTTYNVKNYSPNFYNNLSVFKQKSIKMNIKQNSIRNFKIKLEKLKVDNNTSKSNFKSEFYIKDQPRATTLNLINNNLNNKNCNKTNKNSSGIQTEPCQQTTISLSSAKSQNEDDLIFKKPLPVDKKVLKSPKHFIIQKAISLRTHPYARRKETIRKTETEMDVLRTHTKNSTEIEKSLDDKQTPVIESETNSEFVALVDDHIMDDLTRTSKLLTDKINNLTREIILQNNNAECEIRQSKIAVQEKEDNLITCIQESNRESTDEIDHLETSANDCSSAKEDSPNENDLLSKKIFVFSNPSGVEEMSSNLNAKKISVSNSKESMEEVIEGNEKTNELITKETEENSPANKYQTENDNVALVNTIDAKMSEFTGRPEDNKGTKTADNIEIEEFTGFTETNSASKREKENEMDPKSVEVQQNSINPAPNFSAEFLAGLPNETSPPQNDASENECGTKSDIDFEFENNCTTPTMCRIDLDVMSENTSDVPATMPLTILPIKGYEADKLLENFNNKTNYIVGNALNKKPLISEATGSHSSDEPSIVASSSSEVLPNNENAFNIESSLDDIVKQCDKSIVADKNMVNKSIENVNCMKLIAGPSGQSPEISNILQNITTSKNVIKSSGTSQVNDISPDCEQNKMYTNSNKQSTIDSIQLSTSYINKKTTFSDQQEIKESISEKLQKVKNDQQTLEKIQLSAKDNYKEIIKNLKETLAKAEQSTSGEIKPQEMEASINENQHMTVELGNWKQELKNETKTNDSDAGGGGGGGLGGGGGGVSAIFSFPKIPVISISIHTTTNNKTYFKISKTENDNLIKEGAKSEKTKPPQSDKNGETNDEERPASSANLESNGIKNKENLIQQTVEECNEEDDGAEREEEDEEGHVEDSSSSDTSEIEKISHDSNSACSLPLKKRPTQSETNEDAEDSQSIVKVNYEQPQEIAAEIVIENSFFKDRTTTDESASLPVEQDVKENNNETEQDFGANAVQENSQIEEDFNLLIDFDDNKPSTSSACLKKISDLSAPFKRRVHIPVRSIGHTPIQIVTPQLKDNCPSPSQDHRTQDIQVSSLSSIPVPGTQSLPLSYPATPMLSVANVEKLMDFNRFIEDLLASPDVVTIIDNANACGYYAEGQTYEVERVAILEHYNIANDTGNAAGNKHLYWKKSAGNTISIFNDNDNEWIALPSSTAKQLQKLSFVLSILQQQYKVNDVRRRINIALTFLVRNTSKYKNNSLQQRTSLHSRNISDLNSSKHNVSQTLPSTSYITTNNDMINTESAQEFHSTNYSNNQQQSEMMSQFESVTNKNSHNWSNVMQFERTGSSKTTEQTNLVNSPQRMNFNNVECEHQQQTQGQDKRNFIWDELNLDQLYINPPCATSPQNEVIVNTNGVELHEIPQDQQNIFISITDEAGSANGNVESPLHKYSTRQQQQHFRTIEDREIFTASPPISAQQSYAKRRCLEYNGASVISNNFIRNTFGGKEINLQNPYRMQQQEISNQSLSTTSSTNFPQSNVSAQNSAINICSNNRHPTSMPQQQSQQCMSSIFTSSFNTQVPGNSQQIQIKNNQSNYREILQPYITYLIKDHERTSKHLLQVFEEVTNSNVTVGNNLNQQTLLQNHQQFNNFLPPLIRNPQQNHMPDFNQMSGSTSCPLPSLVRNPHQNILPNRDSGALQVVQSFLEQSQAGFDAVEQQQILTDQPQQHKQTTSTVPGFVKEYVNFVGYRDELAQKPKLHNFDVGQQQNRHQKPQQKPNEIFFKEQEDVRRLNTVKRKCQERNDKLAADLQRKIMEFSLLKRNVQVKLLENHQRQIENPIETIKRRGRPRKMKNTSLEINDDKSFYGNDKCQNKCATRQAKRKQTGRDLTIASTTIDHAYFRQRSAAREAVKRINATINKFSPEKQFST